MTYTKKHLNAPLDSSNIAAPIFENKIGENLLTKEMLADILKISVSYVDKLKIQKKIPFIQIGRCIRFNFVDVMAALNRNGAHYEK